MKKILPVILILFMGFALRAYQLGNRPVGFTWDEAAIGYNAYSLLRTARDEYGQLAPVVFKSFGDYKPGLYIYLTVPSVKIFGLNEFATRLPSALIGTLLLIVIYVLARILFPKILDVGIWSLVIAAINPWLIQFSRGTWEANLNLLLTTLGVTIFLRSIHKQISPLTPLLDKERGIKGVRYYQLCALLFGLTFWSYQSAKLFTPLLLLALIFIYRTRIKLKNIILPFFLFLLLLLPVLINLGSQSGRLKVFSVFSYTRRDSDIAEILRQDGTQNRNFTFFIFHSEFLDQGRGVLQRYLNHLSPRFLFSEGDWTSLRHSVYKHGYFYLIEIIPLCLGVFYLLSHLKAKSYKLTALWIFLAPIPSAMSRDLVSGVRSLALSIPIILIISLGLSHLFSNKSIFKIPTSILYLLLSMFSLVYFLDLYYFHQPYYSAKEWVYPYKQAYQIIAANYDRYSRIYFTDKLGQPYIFALFYLKYEPAKYQQQALLTTDSEGDVGKVRGFDKLIFAPVFWPQLRNQPGSITVGDEYELPVKDLDIPGLVRLADINYPSGHPGLRVVALP